MNPALTCCRKRLPGQTNCQWLVFACSQTHCWLADLFAGHQVSWICSRCPAQPRTSSQTCTGCCATPAWGPSRASATTGELLVVQPGGTLGATLLPSVALLSGVTRGAAVLPGGVVSLGVGPLGVPGVSAEGSFRVLAVQKHPFEWD